MTIMQTPGAIQGVADSRQQLTDGVGIPVTDLARIAQASCIRYIGFRHESDAIHAAAAAGFSDQDTRRVPDGLWTWLSRRPRRLAKPCSANTPTTCSPN